MDLIDNPEAVKILQDELYALVVAWADRGVSPTEAAVVLASNSHMLLAKLGFSLGDVIVMLTKSWERNNGKI